MHRPLHPPPHSYPLSFLTATFIRNAPFPVTETSTASFSDRITSPQNELSVSEEENCFITSGTFPRLIERTAQHEAASFSGAQENTSSYLPEAGQIHLRTLCISRAEEQDSLSIYTSASLGDSSGSFQGSTPFRGYFRRLSYNSTSTRSRTGSGRTVLCCHIPAARSSVQPRIFQRGFVPTSYPALLGLSGVFLLRPSTAGCR